MEGKSSLAELKDQVEPICQEAAKAQIQSTVLLAKAYTIAAEKMGDKRAQQFVERIFVTACEVASEEAQQALQDETKG